MDASFWKRLQAIDSRIIYVALIAVILFPLFNNHLKYNNIPTQQAKNFYQTIEEIAQKQPNALIVVDGQWSPSTRGENKWQTQAILTHLMRRHLHFALVSFDPQNKGSTQLIMDDLVKKYHYEYGKDYVNWGYRPYTAFTQTLKGLVVDVPTTVKTDTNATAITDYEKLPVMRGIKTVKDISAWIEITPTDSIDSVLGLLQGANKTPVLYATTAIGAPKYYPYLDSGQLAGMMTGVKGAGDYETLLNAQTFGSRATGALSFVYALIIGLIVLGNIGYYAGRAAERKAAHR